ncbi:MAG: DUF2141 domain-containing protein [Bacteroidales bacterium]|nr:DUF2141 domain-containing protein [Bacteroidales bacterium]
MKKIFIFIVLLASGFAMIHSQTITVKISGIKNSKGNIRLAFFASEEEYKKEDPRITKYISKEGLIDGCITAVYTDIRPGTYGIALLDDENKNGEMDYSFFLPKEGFGFSDYYFKGLTKPSYKHFSFDIDKCDKTIHIKVRYM